MVSGLGGLVVGKAAGGGAATTGGFVGVGECTTTGSGAVCVTGAVLLGVDVVA